jgi:phosphohistidine swiveling domain-containing protein/nucleoside-diphosphate-sugar epimerase
MAGVRIVVAGLATDVGAALVAELLRRGHQVDELSSMSAGGPPPDVAVCRVGDVAEARAARDAVHQMRVQRLVAVCACGTVDVEELIAQARCDVLLVRTAPIMGRDTTGTIQRRFAAPLITGARGLNAVQFIHPDDVSRFLAAAVAHPEWTGRVGLAADDALGLRDVTALLRRRYVELPRRLAPNRTNYPMIDTTRLRELGFVPAYSSRACVLDFAKANRQHYFLGPARIAVPGRIPWTRVPEPRPTPVHRQPAAGPGLGGEFDTGVDPAWPVYTAVNTAEAFPGPMTPLSLELSLDGACGNGVQAAELLRPVGELRRALEEQGTGSFGHRIYFNVSVLLAAAALLPGANPSAWQDLLFGAAMEGQPAVSGRGRWWRMARAVPGVLALVVAFAPETRRMDREARARQRDAGYYAGLSDDQLYAQLRCARDDVVSAWPVSGLSSMMVAPIMGLLRKAAGRELVAQFRGGTENLASAELLVGAQELAAMARSDTEIAALLHDHLPEQALRRLRTEEPGFVARLDRLVADYGHRGPGETELINPVFADRPARLLDVVVKLAGSDGRPVAPMPAMGPSVRLLAGLGAAFQRSRERARDVAIRYTHGYRLIAREIGDRLARDGVIEHRDDVFYLIRDELCCPPSDVRDRVAWRRAERARLAQQRPPTRFVGQWDCGDVVARLAPGQTLTGMPVSAGVAKGRVRVLTTDSTEDLEPGEVLVAEFTDSGWTPFFGYAAAVVVDTGAKMSHAAVVSREFGIPCVVGSATGSRALRTGDLVEVDGASGLVTRLE